MCVPKLRSSGFAVRGHRLLAQMVQGVRVQHFARQEARVRNSHTCCRFVSTGQSASLCQQGLTCVPSKKRMVGVKNCRSSSIMLPHAVKRNQLSDLVEIQVQIPLSFEKLLYKFKFLRQIAVCTAVLQFFLIGASFVNHVLQNLARC